MSMNILSSKAVERIVAASVRLSGGRIFSHDTHCDAIWVAFHADAFAEFRSQSPTAREDFSAAWQSGELFVRHQFEEGFTTSCGRFVGRDEAHAIALQANQLSACYDKSLDWLDAASLDYWKTCGDVAVACRI